jgi:hypothetical protein
MRLRWSLFSLVVMLGWPHAARADKTVTNACADGYTRGQILRNAGKLIQARDAFRTCAQPSCKAFIVKDCTLWLDQVQASVPTIVPVATDDAGNVLPAVKVSIDGAVVLDPSDGRAVEVNPGSHTLTFEAPDSAKVDKAVLVPEGEKDRRVVATLGKPKAPQGESPLTADSAKTSRPASAPPSGTAGEIGSPNAHAVPWKTVGLVVAGVGVVGAGVGAIFGLDALSKKHAAGCGGNSICPDDASANMLRSAGSAGNLSTIFFVAGGVLAAGGIATWALAPAAGLRAVPSVGRNAAGVVVEGAL